MSKIIASAAIRGAHSIVKQAEEKLAEAVKAHGPDGAVAFPNTAYFLPIAFSMLGHKVEKLSEIEPILAECRSLLPELVDDEAWLPYLGPALDAGMATLLAEEVIEACKYVIGPNPVDGVWLGAADDVILRERGIQFVDGTAPGFAAIVGAAPDVETAVTIARQLQERNLYVFMCARHNGTSFAQQLAEADVQLGWETRLVPFGPDITAAVYALGFANRAALSFGGVAPGDYKRNLLYNKNRVFAFVMALGDVSDEWYATAAGAISYGFPTISDADIPEILPTGVCTYEHVVSNVKHDQIVERAIEVRGLKVKVTEIDLPVPHGPAFEGERIRKEETHVEMGGQRTPAFEVGVTRDMDAITDGQIQCVGPNIEDLEPGSRLPLAFVVELAGRKMQADFEPVLERRFHSFFNEIQGVFHMGQRDIIWMRIGKEAFAAGLRLEHLGRMLHAKLKDEFSAILDKVAITIHTDEQRVLELREMARQTYADRDARLGSLTDETVDTFYSCTLCQSFAPDHVCVITPQRSGLCGAYNWLDGRAAFEITPSGPNQPIAKGRTLDDRLGIWEGVDDFVKRASNQSLESFSAYSMITDPMTSCGCFECISCVLPQTNGVMIVDRNHPGMTPCGMKFSTLAGEVGGGRQTPGFIGHSRRYILSPKFISADGGLSRVVWMNKSLKDEIADELNELAKAEGLGENFADKIADDTVADDEEALAEWLAEREHPALQMEPMF